MGSNLEKTIIEAIVCFIAELVLIYLRALLQNDMFLYLGIVIGIVYVLASLFTGSCYSFDGA